jgi:hypothetical protein
MQRMPSSIPSVGVSADGHSVSIVGSITLGLRVGGIAVVELATGSPAVHVRSVGLATGAGAARSIVADGTVLGRFADGAFSAVQTAGPFDESVVRPATEDEVAAVYRALDEGAATIAIGMHRDHPDLPAAVRSAGFSRHTFMCGQSGSGKTYTTGVLFERLLIGSTLDVLVLDPNSDHVHLTSLADPADPRPEADRYRRVQGTVATFRARGHEATHTLCIDASDLSLDVLATLFRLDPIADLDDFNALGRITRSLTAQYSIGDVAAAADRSPATASIARRIENLGLAEWGLWRRAGEVSAVEMRPAMERVDARWFAVIDTGSLETPTERTLVSLAILGNRWRARRNRAPLLLAIDEAHNVLPAATADPLLEAAVELGALIAGEGRKFGIHLFIASQRPGKVHPNVLTQCDNLLLMRMNGAADVADLESVFSHVPPMLLHEALTFGLGQTLVAGPLAPLPVVAQVGSRLTREGGGDVPTTWTAPPD